MILGLKQLEKTPFHRETFSRCFEHAKESQCLMNVSSTAPKQGLRKACSGKKFVAIWGRLPSNEIPKEMRPIHSSSGASPAEMSPCRGLPFLAFPAFLAIMIRRRHDRFCCFTTGRCSGKRLDVPDARSAYAARGARTESVGHLDECRKSKNW